jgi:leader peptidase (prepilin peptidase)/N-methyltransferase
MSAVIGILLFFLGLAVGSFISCLVFRVNQENRLKGLLKGRSYCPKCKKQLFWYDNIPLISFIFLKGRCRWCHSPIGVHYPLVELATGLATLFVFFHLAGVEVVASPPPRWPNGLLGGVLLSGFGAAGFFWLLVLITRGKGMGWGDVKLAGLMGLFLGYPQIIVALYLAFLTGATAGVILILLGKKKFKSQISFGPFLVGSTFIAWFWGEKIWHLLV